MYGDWRDLHYRVICDFVSELNRYYRDLVLKGGTSLMLCYGLDRFSEDIDFDAVRGGTVIQGFVEQFCKKHNSTMRVAKDTDTVRRYMIHYGGEKPLKVEISYRSNCIDGSELCVVGNVLVYTLIRLLELKVAAFHGRDKIRDLYDVLFIIKKLNYSLPDYSIRLLRDAFSYKGIDYLDYLVMSQSDELIDNNKLYNNFIDVYSWLGFM